MWAKGIIATFVAFAAFMIGLVTICMKQDISLESKDYYKDELAYQQKIDASINALKNKPKFVYSHLTQKLNIGFGEKGISNGKAIFYKPNRSKSDFEVAFNNDLALDMSQKDKGLWKVKLNWEQNGKHFYYEEPLYND